MGFIEKISGTIKDPGDATKQIADDPMIEEAVMIVGIYAILSAFAAFIQSTKITYIFEGLDNMPSSMQSLMTMSTIIAALIIPFIVWIITAGVIHLLALAAGGEGSFYPQIMTIAGFSIIPMLFNGIISIGLFYIIEPQTIIISPSNPTAMKELYSNPSFVIASIAGIIFEIWSTIIFYFGLLSAHKLSNNSAALIAAIPLAFSVLSLIWTFWGMSLI